MTYGPVSVYMAHCAKADNAQVHPQFLAAQKEWLKQHNEEPGRTKLKSKRLLAEAITTLEVVKSLGVSFFKRCWR